MRLLNDVGFDGPSAFDGPGEIINEEPQQHAVTMRRGIWASQVWIVMRIPKCICGKKSSSSSSMSCSESLPPCPLLHFRIF
jgi:hypothetical protein